MVEAPRQTGDGVRQASATSQTRPESPAINHLRSWKTLVVAVAALLCTAYCWRMDLTPDSLHYIDVGRLIAARGQVATLHLTLNSAAVPDPNLLWPPAYPLLLSGLLKLGASASAATALVAVLTFSGTLALMLLALRRVEWVVLAGIVWLYLIAACGIAHLALSEGLFALFATGSLICLGYAAATGTTRRCVPLALLGGLLAGSAALTRWIGLLLIISSPAALVVARLARRPTRLTWTRALVSNAAYVLGALIAVSPWLARNQILNGTPFGPPRPQSLDTLLSLLARAARSTYMEFGAVFLLLLVVWAVTRPSVGERPADPDAGEPTPPTIITYTAAAWGATYTLGLFAALSRYQMGEGPERYLFVAYAAFLFAALLCIDRTRALEEHSRRRLLVMALIALPLLLVPAARAIERRGVKARQPALADWVEVNTGPDSLLIGSGIWELRFFTGRPALESGYPSMPPVTDGRQIAGFLSRFGAHFDRAYLIVTGMERETARRSYEEAGLALVPVEARRLAPRAHPNSADWLYVYEVQWPGKRRANAAPEGPQSQTASLALRPSPSSTTPGRSRPARPAVRP